MRGAGHIHHGQEAQGLFELFTLLQKLRGLFHSLWQGLGALMWQGKKKFLKKYMLYMQRQQRLAHTDILDKFFLCVCIPVRSGIYFL